MSSASLLLSASLRGPNDNTPTRSVSSFNIPRHSIGEHDGDGSTSSSRRTSITSVFSTKRQRESTMTDQNGVKLVEVAESKDERRYRENQSAYRSEGSTSSYESVAPGMEPEVTIVDGTDAVNVPEAPFRRWMSTLRRKRKPPHVIRRTERWELDDFESEPQSRHSRSKGSRHQKSASHASSSISFVRTVKSATTTFACASIGTVSRHNSLFRRGQQSSIVSASDQRRSGETQLSIVDESAIQRSRKRREKIEELLSTEENYVADLKALANAYFTLLGHHKCSTSFARASAQKTIYELLHLHDDVLRGLHHAVPFAGTDRVMSRQPKGNVSHIRWHSVDVIPARSPHPRPRSQLTAIRQRRGSLNVNRSKDDETCVLRCSPQIAAAVGKVFCNAMARFDVYEQYGANYEQLQRDIEELQRTVSGWPEYDRGIEAISAHINPVKSREANKKKAMTVKDLLIKPVQRLPRYELLFGDICKLTPVCDDPECRTTVEETLELLNQACQRMNTAKEHPGRARTRETTWLIGDRLTFDGQLPRSVFLQLLGPVVLCGCLHIAYRGRDHIRGFYLICVLFKSTLLFACVDEDRSTYRTLAGIALANATVEESDNCKGLQCHTAPHSWKLVFEHCARMYEVIMTACSATEASVWREHIDHYIALQSESVADGTTNTFDLQSPLTADMRSIGKAFGKPGSFVRRMSVHRTATVGPTSDLMQVLIKNTQTEKEALTSASDASLHIPRSQSVATPSHVPTLAPRRADRARLETMLSDVWTKDLLPYPGMTRRSDPIRASANHVIRKFSMASIASNFSSKRNASWTSIAQSTRKEDLPPSKLTKAPKAPRPPQQKIDFHTAPEAFLPADFELDNVAEAKRKKSALRTCTMTIEQPLSPFWSTESRLSSLKRDQSVRDATKGSSLRDTATSGQSMAPMYTVIQERAKTPSASQVAEDTLAKSPKKSKSKSKLLRLFG